MRQTTLFLAILLMVSAPAVAEFYKWTDDNGQVHYTQTPPPPGAESESGAGQVEVMENREKTGIELPERVRRKFCADVTELARQVAAAMRNGARASSLITLGQRSAGQALANAIVSFVWRYRNTDDTPSSIAASVAAKCRNGSYTHHVEQHWREQYPDRPMPWAKDGEAPEHARAGTAWAIGPRSLVTSHHVVAGSERVEIVFGENDRVPARIVDTDAEHDLARLHLADSGRSLPPLPVTTEPANLGASVLTIGYPHVDVMGRSPKVTTGVISARFGPRDDQRLYQISVPVQSGNSGGPLFDQHGRVIGVVAGKLNAEAVYRTSGNRPENVNYAVKSEYLRDWVSREAAAADGGRLDTETLVSRVRDSVFIVLAH